MYSNITERGKTIILSKIDLHFNQISELKKCFCKWYDRHKTTDHS